MSMFLRTRIDTDNVIGARPWLCLDCVDQFIRTFLRTTKDKELVRTLVARAQAREAREKT